MATIVIRRFCESESEPPLRSLQLVRLLLATVVLTFISATHGLCPINPQCYCFGKYIYCRNLGNISRVPSFHPSNTTFDRLDIDAETTLTTVQTNAFLGLNVKVIVLNGLGIKTLEPGAFNGLGGILVRLNLDNNKISSLHDDVFIGLNQSLKELSLVGSHLTTVSPAVFRHISQLETLQLAYNWFETIPDDTFSALSQSLKSLYLYSNRLTTLSPIVFSHLIHLKTLCLDYNQLTEIPNETFNKINQSLKRLNLEHNLMTTVNPAIFRDLSNLDWLHLGSNRIKTIHNDAFKGLTSLRILNMQINNLTHVSSGVFTHMANLQQLGLEQNQITTIQDDAFSGFSDSMKWVIVNDNQLSTVSASLFINLKRLEALHIENNPFVCDCRLAWFRTLKASICRDTPVCFSPSKLKGISIKTYTVSPCKSSTTMAANTTQTAVTSTQIETTSPPTLITSTRTTKTTTQKTISTDTTVSPTPGSTTNTKTPFKNVVTEDTLSITLSKSPRKKPSSRFESSKLTPVLPRPNKRKRSPDGTHEQTDEQKTSDEDKLKSDKQSRSQHHKKVVDLEKRRTEMKGAKKAKLKS